MFEKIFIGEYVNLVTRTITVVTTSDSNGDIASVEAPLEIQGFLLDMDEEFLYLGKNSNEVDQALLKTEFTHISIFTPETAPVIDLTDKKVN